jgi:hypothetical protein
VQYLGETAKGPWRAELKGPDFVTLTIRPAMAVKVKGDVPVRLRPGPTPGFPAGTVLFSYKLHRGVAYCEPLRVGDRRRVQCLRDFNDDGAFDGAYVSSTNTDGGGYLFWRVESLTPIRSLPYETAPVDDLPPMDLSLGLVSVGANTAILRFTTIDDRWEVQGEKIEGRDDAYLFRSGVFQIKAQEKGVYSISRIILPEGEPEVRTSGRDRCGNG